MVSASTDPVTQVAETAVYRLRNSPALRPLRDMGGRRSRRVPRTMSPPKKRAAVRVGLYPRRALQRLSENMVTLLLLWFDTFSLYYISQRDGKSNRGRTGPVPWAEE